MSAFVHGVYFAGAVTGLIGTGLYLTADYGASSTVTGTTSYQQANNTVASEGTLGPNTYGTPRQVVNLYVTTGVTGQVRDGKFITTGYGLGGAEAAVAYTQANNTLNPNGTGTTGTTGVNCAVTYTQANNTLNPNGVGVTSGTVGGSTYTQANNTLNPNGTGTVTTLLLAGSMEVDIAGPGSYTQANNALLSTGSVATVGNITAGVGFAQANNTLASVVGVTVRGTSAYTQANNLVNSGSGDIGDRSLDLTFVTGAGGTPQTGIYQYAFFEAETPTQLGFPTHKGNALVGTTGRCVIVLPGSALASGDTGFLVLADGSGAPATPWRSFCGPVRVL